ncbi:hypothetical protein SAVIM338S_06072 [Streptomyces avidinii]
MAAGGRPAGPGASARRTGATPRAAAASVAVTPAAVTEEEDG